MVELDAVVDHPVLGHPLGVAIAGDLAALLRLAVGAVHDLGVLGDQVGGGQLGREPLARRAVGRRVDGLPRVHLHPARLGGVEQGEVGVDAERPDGIERVAEAVVGLHGARDVGPRVDQLLRDAVDAHHLVEAARIGLGVEVERQPVGRLHGQRGEEVLRVVLHVLVVAVCLAAQVADAVGDLLVDRAAHVQDPLRAEVALAAGDEGPPAGDHVAAELVEVGGLGDEVHVAAGPLALRPVHRRPGPLHDVHGLDLVEAGQERVAAIDRALSVLVDLAELAADHGDVREAVSGRGIDAGRILVEVGRPVDRAGLHLRLGHQAHRARRVQDRAIVAHHGLHGPRRGKHSLGQRQALDDHAVHRIGHHGGRGRVGALRRQLLRRHRGRHPAQPESKPTVVPPGPRVLHVIRVRLHPCPPSRRRRGFGTET